MSDESAPTWRYLVAGLLFGGLAAYMLVTGEIAVDKQRSMIVTRAGNPLMYWGTVLVSGTIGALALRAAWKRITGP